MSKYPREERCRDCVSLINECYCDKLHKACEEIEICPLGEAIPIPNDRLMRILENYICNDLEVADPSYVYEVLTDYCGCTDEEIRQLGFAELID